MPPASAATSRAAPRTLQQRLGAMRRMAMAGYPVGLTVAPIMPVEDWRSSYTELFRLRQASSLPACRTLDLTVELITHRFTPGSKEVLLGWYPKTTLDLDEANRAEKRTKVRRLQVRLPQGRYARDAKLLRRNNRRHAACRTDSLLDVMLLLSFTRSFGYLYVQFGQFTRSSEQFTCSSGNLRAVPGNW